MQVRRSGRSHWSAAPWTAKDRIRSYHIDFSPVKRLQSPSMAEATARGKASQSLRRDGSMLRNHCVGRVQALFFVDICRSFSKFAKAAAVHHNSHCLLLHFSVASRAVDARKPIQSGDEVAPGWRRPAYRAPKPSRS